jgi:hypothetical protein
MSCHIRGQVSRQGSPLGRGVQLRTDISPVFSYTDYGFRAVPQASAGVSRHLKTVTLISTAITKESLQLDAESSCGDEAKSI